MCVSGVVVPEGLCVSSVDFSRGPNNNLKVQSLEHGST